MADVFKIKWKQENDYEKSKKLSNIWHGISMIIHILIVTCLVMIGWVISDKTGALIFYIIGILVVWPIHNIIIALGLGQKWWYVGTTSKIDILLRKIWKYIKEKWNRT